MWAAQRSLRYFDRRNTNDIDAKVYPAQHAMNAVAEVARENLWPEDWLNTKATQFIPIAKDPGWECLYDDDDVSVWVASAAALLAMKLTASRPGRDDDDIANLLVLCDVTSVQAAEELYEEYYRGEVLPDKAYLMLSVIFAEGLPPRPQTPPRPLFA